MLASPFFILNTVLLHFNQLNAEAVAAPNGNAIGNSNGHRICHLKKDVVLKELECYEETRLFEETMPEIESSVDKKGKEKKRMDEEEIRDGSRNFLS